MRLFKVIIAMVSLLVCSTIVYAGDYSLALNYGRAMPLETSEGKKKKKKGYIKWEEDFFL